jgi:chromosome segregation ATPase
LKKENEMKKNLAGAKFNEESYKTYDSLVDELMAELDVLKNEKNDDNDQIEYLKNSVFEMDEIIEYYQDRIFENNEIIDSLNKELKSSINEK